MRLMYRSIASSALTLLVFIVIAAGCLIVWGQSQYRGEGPLGVPICLSIKRGTTMLAISQDLKERNAISDARIFRIGVDYAGKSGDLKAGSFLVPASSSMQEIVDIVTRGGPNTCGLEIVYRIGVDQIGVRVRELDLLAGRFVDIAEFDPVEGEAPGAFEEWRSRPSTRYRLVMAEGATVWQVVEDLKAVDILAGDVSELPLEGRLAPGSYEISVGGGREELLAEMEARQEHQLEKAWRNRLDELPIATKEEALILASIIEKETGLADERRQVAAVFVNRLRRGMRLQADPTVIYGITNGQGGLGRGIRRSELQRPTPYNTYQVNGLPPTPIANPGLESIEAALNPDDKKYLFFVADGSGGHAFAETLSEHNRNVAKWRAIEAQRADR